MDSPSQIDTESAVDGTLVVQLRGEIDVMSISSMQAELESTVAAADRVTLDLSGVTFLDSAGLRMLQLVSSDFLATRRQLRIIAPEGSVVRRLLDLTGLTEVLAVGNA
jgi:anti-sigma B factor antagonist